MISDKELKKKEKALAKSWKNRTLPVIEYMPDFYNKENKRRLRQADEEKLVIKYTGSSVVAGIGVLLLWMGSLGFWTNYEPEFLPLLLSFGGIGALLLLYYFSMPKKYWVFNRRTQMVTVPGRHYTKGINIPMDKMRIETRATMSNVGVSRVYPVAIVPSNKFEEFLRINVASLETLNQAGKLYKLWSYYVWYMDENRPLPPGKIFDHCREREFANRRKRGFPMPKYYSLVPTSEATPEFQKERDKYWTDEMFCPDVNKYGECCLDPNKEKFPSNSFWYNDKNNPENWKRKKFEDPSVLKYKPEIEWLRFVFEDGKVIYTLNILGGALFPPP